MLLFLYIYIYPNIFPMNKVNERGCLRRKLVFFLFCFFSVKWSLFINILKTCNLAEGSHTAE